MKYCELELVRPTIWREKATEKGSGNHVVKDVVTPIRRILPLSDSDELIVDLAYRL
jgi:hypothetical protein